MQLHHVEKVFLVKPNVHVRKCTMLKKFFGQLLRALYVFTFQCYTGVFWKMDVVSGLE